MSFLRLYSDFTSRISTIAVQLAMVAVVLMAGHFLLEIILRAVFRSSAFVMDEFIGYELGAMTFLGLGSALDHKVLLRLNLVLLRFKGPSRAFIEIVNASVTLSLFSGLLFFLVKLMTRNFMRGTTSISVLEVPVWIPQAFIVTGLVVFCLQLTGLIARALKAPNDLD